MHSIRIELVAQEMEMVVGEGFEPSKAFADRFTVCSLWPLGNPTKTPVRKAAAVSSLYALHAQLAEGVEPPTS
jgi:hypothetical protein